MEWQGSLFASDSSCSLVDGITHRGEGLVPAEQWVIRAKKIR